VTPWANGARRAERRGGAARQAVLSTSVRDQLTRAAASEDIKEVEAVLEEHTGHGSAVRRSQSAALVLSGSRTAWLTGGAAVAAPPFLGAGDQQPVRPVVYICLGQRNRVCGRSCARAEMMRPPRARGKLDYFTRDKDMRTRFL
jgi:hypothetical protein